MQRRLICLLTVLSLCACSDLAFAQQPPAGQPPPGPPPKQEGSAEFAFVGTSGNSSTQTIGIGGEFIYRPSPWETRFKTAYVRNESEDVLKAQSFILTLRAQRPVKPRLAAYGQYGYQRDRFAGIINRNAVEGGLAFTWVDAAPNKLVVDAGLGYANEQREVGENLSTATFNTGGLYKLKFTETSELSEEGRFVFSLSDGSDWRYANVLSLVTKITTVFSLKVSNNVRYVNAPVIGFKSTDSITSIALVAKF